MKNNCFCLPLPWLRPFKCLALFWAEFQFWTRANFSILKELLKKTRCKQLTEELVAHLFMKRSCVCTIKKFKFVLSNWLRWWCFTCNFTRIKSWKTWGYSLLHIFFYPDLVDKYLCVTYSSMPNLLKNRKKKIATWPRFFSIFDRRCWISVLVPKKYGNSNKLRWHKIMH